MPRWIPLWWLGLCLAVGGTVTPLRAGGPCTSAPPCPETTCPAPPAKIVVEMSPPEVVFQQAPAPAPQACHHGLFHKHCEAPAPAAPAAPPVTTQTATYF